MGELFKYWSIGDNQDPSEISDTRVEVNLNYEAFIKYLLFSLK